MNEKVLFEGNATDVVTRLREKTVNIERGWDELVKEYDPKLHPVMTDRSYNDIVKDNQVEHVTRVTYDYQRLASDRMAQLTCGIPVLREYSTENKRQEEIAKYIEAIFQRNRIDGINLDRLKMLFASCEIFTLWNAYESPNVLYGFESTSKLRCRTFSPMLGHSLYPLFDNSGDMVAMSIETSVERGGKKVKVFDTYTATAHYHFEMDGSKWSEPIVTPHTLGKIPGTYVYRPTPIWENESNTVYELEWSISRNGNYLRRNLKPIFVITSGDGIRFGDERSEKEEFRSIVQLPQGGTAGYATWQQAIENLEFYISELRQSFFSKLQIPDWSYENMKSSPMSGESRKQLFIDAHLKVLGESGKLLEFFDREVNVVKAHLKTLLNKSYHEDIDKLQVSTTITPYNLEEESENINNLSLAYQSGLISRREAIEKLGWSNDVAKTIEEIFGDKERDRELDVTTIGV